MQIEIDIRQAILSDAESIAANIKMANTAEEIRQQIVDFAEKGWTHLVAVIEGEVAGNIAIIPTRYFPVDQPHRAELADVVVAPGYKGSGLLEKLVDAAAAHARTSGVTQLETAAWLSNPRAVHAYPKVGFVEWGRLPNAKRSEDGNYDTLVFYRLELV